MAGGPHKTKSLPLRLHPVLRAQLEELCARNLSTLTAEIVRALIEHLRREGLWPPPPPGGGHPCEK
jgi:hypothetical protein